MLVLADQLQIHNLSSILVTSYKPLKFDNGYVVNVKYKYSQNTAVNRYTQTIG